MNDVLKRTDDLQGAPVAVAEKNPLSLNLFGDQLKVLGTDEARALVVQATQDPQVVAAADEALANIRKVLTDPIKRDTLIAGVRSLGLDAQLRNSGDSKMLERTVSSIMNAKGQATGVTNDLLELRSMMRKLNPGQIRTKTFSAFVEAVIGWMPFVGPSAVRYLARYESVKSVVTELSKSIEDGAALLQRNDVTYDEDQKVYRRGSLEVAKHVAVAMQLYQRLKETVNSLPDGDEKTFLQTQVQFRLQRRIQSMLSDINVMQQGVMSCYMMRNQIEVLVDNSTETRTITTKMFGIALATAIGLSDLDRQRMAVDGMRETTGKMMRENARRLNAGTTAIQEQAVKGPINIEDLAASYADLQEAWRKTETFMQQALPAMEAQALKLTSMQQANEKIIDRMERGDEVRKAIPLFTQKLAA